MTPTCDLIELVKINNGITSDYAVAKLLNISKAIVSHWRTERSEANGVNLLRLIKASGISIEDALILMTKSPTVKGEASKSNSDSLYIMLNSISIKLKAKLFNVARKYDMQSICIYLLKTN